MTEYRKKTTAYIAFFILILVSLGCSLPGVLSGPTPTPIPTVIPPTPTLAPPPVTPLPEAVRQEAANALEEQIISVYDTVGASVVNITNRGYVYDIFGRAIPQGGSGSGFVYDTRGHIVTNYHVIENADELLVTFAGGQVLEAQVVGTDPANDLAVIKIDPQGTLPDPVALADSDRPARHF